MFRVVRFFSLIAILTMGCSFKVKEDADTFTNVGNIIRTFGSGGIQCQSEIDSEGHIFVLLKSLNKNTTLTFLDVILMNLKPKKSKYIVKVLVAFQEDSNTCIDLVDTELYIQIDLLPTQTVSLKGKQVYISDHITVMTL
jgi:hypothetical protein